MSDPGGTACSEGWRVPEEWQSVLDSTWEGDMFPHMVICSLGKLLCLPTKQILTGVLAMLTQSAPSPDDSRRPEHRVTKWPLDRKEQRWLLLFPILVLTLRGRFLGSITMTVLTKVWALDRAICSCAEMIQF